MRAFARELLALTEAGGLSPFLKFAAELTEEKRDDLPKKDFAVPASKSNTGEKAYPIPDRQHAASALGFAKMHGDSADLTKVKAKVEAKYPDMVEDKEKDSGFLGDAASSLKRLALTDVGGPKGILQPVGQVAANAGKAIAKAPVSKRLPAGVHDVSRMAQQMGV